MKSILLDYYSKDITQCLACFVDGNCNVSHNLARDLKRPLVGCYSHKFNLEIEYM
jgi:hypothetical protein